MVLCKVAVIKLTLDVCVVGRLSDLLPRLGDVGGVGLRYYLSVLPAITTKHNLQST